MKNKTRKNKRSKKNKTIKYSMKPKKINGKIHFPDHPEFKPNLTPREIFKLGSFLSDFIDSSLTKSKKDFIWGISSSLVYPIPL